MHDIPRKDREDADDVDEDEVSEVTEVSGGLSWSDPDGCIPNPITDYPQLPVGITDPLKLDADLE